MGKKNDASLLPSAGEGPKGTPESLVTTPWEDTLEARAAALLTGGEPLVLVTVVSPHQALPRAKPEPAPFRLATDLKVQWAAACLKRAPWKRPATALQAAFLRVFRAT